MTRAASVGVEASEVLARVRAERDAIVSFVRRLAEHESPTDDPAAQAGVQALLVDALGEIGYVSRLRRGVRSGGLIVARPRERTRGLPLQLLVGHGDTVWPHGTVEEMPVREAEGRLHGPGTFDMKAGLALMVFALRVLRDLGATPPATPVVLVNSDEEIGSPESGCVVRRLARRACRAFVTEPAAGPSGKLKTARKGVGSFEVEIYGRAAHAGLAPGEGSSAIAELAHVIGALHALDEGGDGTTVNVGVVRGGTRPNVVAARATAEVDVRVARAEDGRRVEAAILGLGPATPGVRVEVGGGMRIPPLERTPRNRKLWERARAAASALGLDVEETMVGGASDGSVISQFTATLDGLGAVGDGAHALHEHIVIDATVDRCALLALLLMAPVDG